MKNIKTRIAAAAFAAVTTVCGMQALTASADTTFYYTTVTQEQGDEPGFMGQAQKRWARDNGIYSGSIWNKTVTSGAIIGEGYARGTRGSANQGTPLYGNQAFARYLAHSYFGTKTFMEKYISTYTEIKQGDQIRVYRGNQVCWLFVVYVNNVNNNTLDLFYLDSSNQIVRTTWSRSGWRLNDGTNNWTMDYLIRPIKEGDMNGDGLFTTADQTWLQNHVGSQPNQYPKTVAQAGVKSSDYRDDAFASAAWAYDWQIPYSTYYKVGYNLHNPDENTTGHMRGNYGYVKLGPNG